MEVKLRYPETSGQLISFVLWAFMHASQSWFTFYIDFRIDLPGSFEISGQISLLLG